MYLTYLNNEYIILLGVKTMSFLSFVLQHLYLIFFAALCVGVLLSLAYWASLVGSVGRGILAECLIGGAQKILASRTLPFWTSKGRDTLFYDFGVGAPK